MFIWLWLKIFKNEIVFRRDCEHLEIAWANVINLGLLQDVCTSLKDFP